MTSNKILLGLLSTFFFISTVQAQTNITSCQTISASGTYILQNDVSSPDICFLIRADNVVLDLNGHTVRYADRTSEPIIPNFGFETAGGSSVLAANWDSSAASSASRTSSYPAIKDPWIKDEVGSYAMKFASPASAQYVYSQPIPNVEAGTIHVLSTLLYRHRSVADYVKAWVINSSGTELCGTSYHSSPSIADRDSYWSANDCGFNPTPSDLPVRVKIGTTQGFSGDAYFDAVEVKAGNDYIYPSYNGGVSEMVGVRAGGESDPNRNNLRITNGNIVQGNGKAYYTRAVYIGGGTGIEIDNLKITTYGADATGIYTPYANEINIHDNELTINGRRVHYSHAAWSGAILADGYGGGAVLNRIYNNTVFKSPGLGISCSRYNTDIYGNTINIQASTIHSYGIKPKQNSRVYDNYIQTDYGSGIFLEGLEAADDAGQVIDVEVYNNYIDVRDIDHEDYTWTGKAIWSRYRVGNLNIHDNTFIGYSGKSYPLTGFDTDVAVVRLGGNDDTRGPIYFRNNIVEAYTNDPDTTMYQTGTPTYAIAIEFNVDGPVGITKYVENNTFKSNNIVVAYAPDYGEGHKAKLKNNKFVRINTTEYPATTYFHTIFAGRVNALANEIIDSVGENGADINDVTLECAQNQFELDIKWTLIAMVKGSDGRCIEGAAVTITNPSARVSTLTGSTNSGGVIAPILLDRYVRFASHVATDEVMPDYTVSADYSGNSTQATVTMDLRKEITLTLSEVIGNTDCDAAEPWTPGGGGSDIDLPSGSGGCGFIAESGQNNGLILISLILVALFLVGKRSKKVKA